MRPTKNNIESSRGHTCILLRFGGESSNYRYFPLFDMAGTEDPVKVKLFIARILDVSGAGLHDCKTDDYACFGDGNDEKILNLASILLDINNATKVMINNEHPSKELKSLNDGFKKIKELIATKLDIKESDEENMAGTRILGIIKEDSQFSSVDAAKKFLLLPGLEGYNINDTIAMTMFAGTCVGASMNSIKEIDTDTDKFDNILKEVQNKLERKICSITDTTKSCTNTRYMSPDDSLTYSNLLNRSCIWLQILFTFLYWNKETEKSSTKLLTDLDKIKENEKYFPEMHIDADVPDSNMKIGDLKNNKIVKLFLKSVKDGADSKDGSDSKDDVEDDDKSDTKIWKIFQSFMKNIDNLTITNDDENIKIKDKKLEYSGTIDSNCKFTLEDGNETIVKLKGIAKKTFELDVSSVRRGNSDNDVELLKIIAYWRTGDGGGSNITFILDNINKETLRIKTKTVQFKNSEEGDPQMVNDSVKSDSLKILKYLEDINKKNSPVIDIVPHIVKELYHIIGELYDDSDDYSIILKNNYNAIIKLDKIIPFISNDKDNIIKNQMNRVKDSRIAATKMVLMHCITGQCEKQDMVDTTFTMCETLYDVTTLKLSDSDDLKSGGYLKKSRKKRVRYRLIR